MGMMIVRHKVRDYGEWRPIFDQHAEMRRRLRSAPFFRYGASGLNHSCRKVVDANRQSLAYVYSRETKGAADIAKVPTKRREPSVRAA